MLDGDPRGSDRWFSRPCETASPPPTSVVRFEKLATRQRAPRIVRVFVVLVHLVVPSTACGAPDTFVCRARQVLHSIGDCERGQLQSTNRRVEQMSPSRYFDSGATAEGDQRHGGVMRVGLITFHGSPRAPTSVCDHIKLQTFFDGACFALCCGPRRVGRDTPVCLRATRPRSTRRILTETVPRFDRRRHSS